MYLPKMKIPLILYLLIVRKPNGLKVERIFVMKIYLYLSLIPESLIASHLAPEEFGSYFATGTQRRSRGRAIFFEVDPDFQSDYLPLDKLQQMCVPHEDGRPRKSKYLSVYRVLEHVPLDKLGKLYLTTEDGRTLAIEPQTFTPGEGDKGLHLYQEFAPVRPRVVTQHDPVAFTKRITDPAEPVSVPKIAFAELRLDDLSHDPEKAVADDLPYPNIAHLRDCLLALHAEPQKGVKTVVRTLPQEVLYRTLKNGFFVGAGSEVRHYPLPPLEQLEREYYEWWRSALAAFG